MKSGGGTVKLAAVLALALVGFLGFYAASLGFIPDVPLIDRGLAAWATIAAIAAFGLILVILR